MRSFVFVDTFKLFHYAVNLFVEAHLLEILIIIVHLVIRTFHKSKELCVLYIFGRHIFFRLDRELCHIQICVCLHRLIQLSKLFLDEVNYLCNQHLKSDFLHLFRRKIPVCIDLIINVILDTEPYLLHLLGRIIGICKQLYVKFILHSHTDLLYLFSVIGTSVLCKIVDDVFITNTFLKHLAPLFHS